MSEFRKYERKVQELVKQFNSEIQLKKLEPGMDGYERLVVNYVHHWTKYCLKIRKQNRPNPPKISAFTNLITLCK